MDSLNEKLNEIEQNNLFEGKPIKMLDAPHAMRYLIARASEEEVNYVLANGSPRSKAAVERVAEKRDEAIKTTGSFNPKIFPHPNVIVERDNKETAEKIAKRKKFDEERLSRENAKTPEQKNDELYQWTVDMFKEAIRRLKIFINSEQVEANLTEQEIKMLSEKVQDVQQLLSTYVQTKDGKIFEEPLNGLLLGQVSGMSTNSGREFLDLIVRENKMIEKQKQLIKPKEREI